MSESKSVDLPVNCLICGEGVLLQVQDWMGLPFVEQTWTCPYVACQKPNKVTISGNLTMAAADYRRRAEQAGR